jgi:hypothetical protein
LKKYFLIFIIAAGIFILFFSTVFLSGKLYGVSRDYETGNWRVINTLHFDIYYTDETSELALYTAKAAEQSYIYLANCFKHEIGIVIPIVIHSGKISDYLQNAGRIDLSFAGSYRLLRKELTHRMVHSFQYDILFNTKPGWDIIVGNGFQGIPSFITEGMAVYLSAGYEESAESGTPIIFNQEKFDSQIDIKALKNFKGQPANLIGKSFFYFLEKSFGEGVISELMLNLRDIDNIYEAISISTGITIGELNTKWIDFFKQRNNLGTGKNVNKIFDSLIKRLNEISSLSKNTKFFIKSWQSSNLILLHETVTGKCIAEIKLPFTEVKDAEISSDGKFLVFIGQSYGSADIYLYEVKNKILTRITNNYFEKRYPKISADNSSIVFISNENEQKDNESNVFKLVKYDLKTTAVTIIADNSKEIINAEYRNIKYPDSYFDMNDAVIADYSDELNFDFSTAGGGVIWNKSFTGFINIKAQDFLKMHKLEFDLEYIRYKKNDNDNDLSYIFNYEFLKYRTGLGIGTFYKASPLESGFNSGYMDNTGNALTFYGNNINSNNYGINGHLIFPFIDKSFIKFNYSSTIYENTNSIINNYRKNIYSKQLSLSLNYDGLIYNKVWPVSGTRGELSICEDFDINKREPSLSVLGINFLKFFHYNNLFVFSFKGSGGKISGRDKDNFNYYIGGFNSVRGYEPFTYNGRNSFVLNTEIRFVLIDRLTFKWPSEIKFNDISLALFADFGSAWDTNYNLIDSVSNKFDDLKSGIGYGVRFLFQDHIIFKIDVVWPYFYQSFGKREIISGFEFRY